MGVKRLCWRRRSDTGRRWDGHEGRRWVCAVEIECVGDRWEGDWDEWRVGRAGFIERRGRVRGGGGEERRGRPGRRGSRAAERGRAGGRCAGGASVGSRLGGRGAARRGRRGGVGAGSSCLRTLCRRGSDQEAAAARAGGPCQRWVSMARHPGRNWSWSWRRTAAGGARWRRSVGVGRTRTVICGSLRYLPQGLGCEGGSGGTMLRGQRQGS